MIIRRKKPIIIGLMALLVFGAPFMARAATLSLSPASGNINKGNIFTVKVLVGTQGVAINAVDATISFPPSLLRVVSVSDAHSIFSLWPQVPAYSNNDGTITLSGGIPTPGFVGTGGDVIDIVFQAEKPGIASILISSGDVLANDGEGTNVLSASNDATMMIADYIPPASSRVSTAPSASGAQSSAVQFSLAEASSADATDPSVSFVVHVSGDAAGIDHYVFQIDGGASVAWVDNGSHRYVTSPIAPGDHVLVGHAVDAAENSFTASANFTVEPLNTPTISSYPKNMQTGDVLIIQGTTYPNSTVTVWLQKQEDDAVSMAVDSDRDGNFTFADQNMQPGVYTAWIIVTDSRGAVSLPDDKMTIVVAASPLIQAGTSIMNVLALAVPLVALIIILVLMLFYGWNKFSKLRRRVTAESHNAERVLHKVVDLLRNDMKAYIAMVKKTRKNRDLSQEEEKMNGQFEKDIDLTESLMRGEIEDIEKEIK